MKTNSNSKPRPMSRSCASVTHPQSGARSLRRYSRSDSIAVLPMQEANLSTEFKVIIPWPPKELSPNARCHWAVKNRAKQRFQTHARIQMHNCFVATVDKKPRWKAAKYSIRALCGKSRRVRPDEDNLIASLKPALDCLQTVGIVENDRGLSIAKSVEWIKTNAKESLVELTVWSVEHE